jgi:hypothetical protein
VYSVSTAVACRWLGDEDSVEELAADGTDEAFGDRVARGARTGVLVMRMSAAVSIASNAALRYNSGQGRESTGHGGRSCWAACEP